MLHHRPAISADIRISPSKISRSVTGPVRYAEQIMIMFIAKTVHLSAASVITVSLMMKMNSALIVVCAKDVP